MVQIDTLGLETAPGWTFLDSEWNEKENMKSFSSQQLIYNIQ